MRRCVEEAHEAQNKQCRLDVYVSICEIFRAVFARLDPLPCPVDVRREEASRESVRRVIKRKSVCFCPLLFQVETRYIQIHLHTDVLGLVRLTSPKLTGAAPSTFGGSVVPLRHLLASNKHNSLVCAVS